MICIYFYVITIDKTYVIYIVVTLKWKNIFINYYVTISVLIIIDCIKNLADKQFNKILKLLIMDNNYI